MKLRLLTAARLAFTVGLGMVGWGTRLLAAAPQVPTAQTATIGDPKQPDRLPQALQDAYAGGARTIIIRPGTYFLPRLGRTVFLLNGWRDVKISAYGVTLILTDMHWMHDAFDLDHCTHVILAGAVISQNKITSYQGRILAVGKDDSGKDYCDWKPSPGYPVPPADAQKFPSCINILDAQSHLFKLGVGDFYDAPVAPNPDGTYRIHIGGHFQAGDWLVGRYGDAPFKVFLNHSRDCIVQDVTLVRNGFAPLREDGGGGNHYRHIVWALGPPPAGASDPPLVTNAADGMHMTGSYPGPDIENCVFQGVFLDDCIAIHGEFQTIQAASGPTLTLSGGIGTLTAGGPVRISDTKGFFGEASVVSLKDNGDKTTTVVLDKDLSVPVGAKLSSPLADGAGYKIVGCRLGNTRSRGILVKADSGLIENNVIQNCGMSAISAGPEYYWNEADYVNHLTISGNMISGNGRFGGNAGAVYVHGDGAQGNRDITVADNRFASNYDRDIQAEWADGVTLSGNSITGAAAWPSALAPQSPIVLAHSANITLSGNIVRHASVYNSMLVSAGDSVTGLSAGSPAGIRAASK